MLWCFIGASVSCLILALAALLARPPRISRIRPVRMARGCLATLFLLLALGLIAAVLLSGLPLPTVALP